MRWTACGTTPLAAAAASASSATLACPTSSSSPSCQTSRRRETVRAFCLCARGTLGHMGPGAVRVGRCGSVTRNRAHVHAGGRPLVVSDPTCGTSSAFMELGAAVVREVAKQAAGAGAAGGATASKARVVHDTAQNLVLVRCVSLCVLWGAGWLPGLRHGGPEPGARQVRTCARGTGASLAGRAGGGGVGRLPHPCVEVSPPPPPVDVRACGAGCRARPSLCSGPPPSAATTRRPRPSTSGPVRASKRLRGFGGVPGVHITPHVQVGRAPPDAVCPGALAR